MRANDQPRFSAVLLGTADLLHHVREHVAERLNADRPRRPGGAVSVVLTQAPAVAEALDVLAGRLGAPESLNAGKRLAIRKPRETALSKDELAGWALEVLGLMAKLPRAERERVLRQALKVNTI